MESTKRKGTMRPWHRDLFCCQYCPSSIPFFSTTKTAAAPETSEVTVRMNSNGDIIMTQPRHANGISVNGIPASASQKALRRLGVQSSQDRDFDEIDLGDDITTSIEPNKRLQRESSKEFDGLGTRGTNDNNNRVSSTFTSGSTSGVSTMSKPQSVKSNSTESKGDETTRQLTDIMLSDVINERFDADDDLPQIIEEEFSNVDTNVVTEATAEEVESESRRHEQSSSVLSNVTSPSSSSRTQPAVNISSNAKTIAEEATLPTADIVLAKISQLKRITSTSSEDTENDDSQSKSMDSTSDFDPAPRISSTASLGNIQQYGGFYESAPTAPTTQRMYADLEEEDENNSEGSDASNAPKEILTIGAIGAGKKVNDTYEKLEDDSEASERPPQIQTLQQVTQ